MLLRRITEHVRTQNWFAVGLDFLIVVTGVFIGMQVANWNDARKERAAEQRYLVELARDLEADVAELQRGRRHNLARLATSEAILLVVDPDYQRPGFFPLVGEEPAPSPSFSGYVYAGLTATFTLVGTDYTLRRQDELDSLVAEIESAGGTATAIQTDVAVAEDVERMVEHAITTFGRLDYAVNNAGIEGRFAGITELTEADWDQVLGINLKGTFLGMQHQARAMLAAGNGGAIVNVGSVNSFLGFATGAAYCTPKHGLIGLTTSVSAELASQGIRVNLVCPGIVDTPMHQRLRRDIGDEIYDQGVLPSVHLRRAGQPEEIARAIVFLCSDEASYITGTTLTPDGGLTLTV